MVAQLAQPMKRERRNMSSQKRSKKQNRTRVRDRRRRKRGMNPLYAVIPITLVVVMVGGALLASPEIFSSPDESVQLPSWLQHRGPKVQRAYAQAVAHRDELQYIPCYCGCGNMGHAAVADCHIANVAADGSIIFDEHAST